MLYVPMIPHHQDPPSPRTRELADLLGKVLEEYEKYHPSVTGREVRAAFAIAARRSRSPASASREIALVGVALAIVIMGVGIWVAAGGPETLPAVIVSAVVLGIIALVAGIVLAWRARGG